MSIQTIQWKNKCLRIIDQTQLPLKLAYLDCRDVKSVWQAIKELKVRGAPAIGIAACFGVVLGLKGCKAKAAATLKKKADLVIDYLASSRPTAVNLFWALERMREVLALHTNSKVARIQEALLEEAFRVLEEDKQICRQMADYGADLIRDNESYLTICNAGALATADYGTALGVFYRAKERGRIFQVFACETRPLLQGARLTSWELKKHKIEVTLIADNTVGYLMSQGKIDQVFVGADRIAQNGDTANKIGTFNLALISSFYKVPFYVVAPSSTFDLKLHSGKDIPIEHRHSNEVLKLQSAAIAPKGVKAYNPAFDVTPNALISGFITEKGILHPPFA